VPVNQGTSFLRECENTAIFAGFSRANLRANLAGVPDRGIISPGLEDFYRFAEARCSSNVFMSLR